MSDDVDEHLAALCEALAATESLALDRDANRWLGEAQAVATDVRDASVSDAVLAERVETVRELLSEARPTGDDRGDELVAEAMDHAEAVLEAD